MDCCVKWGSQLEKLADELFVCWQDAVKKTADPFGKVCVVVYDSATENWLKQYFLLNRKIPQVMMNLEFVRLPEFVNNWLAAAVHGTDPRQRRASEHPYSPDVLSWRIYRILSESNPESNPELKELLTYIDNSKDENKKQLRQRALSVKLAGLYDDYLKSRAQMLRNWEKGERNCKKELPPWQISLYQQLAKEESQTYAKDYEEFFSPEMDAGRAFEYGFPRYLAVHVFDIPFMPETTLHLLEKISEAVPMTFWNFNPSHEWLGESDSKREAVREIRKKYENQRELLQKGNFLSEESSILDTVFETPEDRLLGTLASGARAMICNLCKDSEGRVEPAGEEALPELKKRKIFLHSNYSPRRELEAIKDGLHEFFRGNPELHPHDAIILCADWESYAPIIESVFNTSRDSKGYIPVTVAGGVAGETPFRRSFQTLLSFRDNRFEAGEVFSLLEMPAIREKYQLDERTVSVLRDLVKEANIHWGYDDEDVQRILDAKSNGKVHYPFTWQRGLDRLIAEFLHGFNEDGYTILESKGLGRLRPCGAVEGERAEAVGTLWHLIDDLKWIRTTFTPDCEADPEKIQQELLEGVSRFYSDADETILKELTDVRKIIRNTAANVRTAGIDKVSVEVFITAVLEALSGTVRAMRTPGDAVLFAPLNCVNAVPHPLVWICGLNDGVFPKNEYRPSYDLLGKHPSLFDVTAREKDAFALLKAVLCAEKQLCISYVGRNCHTNESMPPSVLLNDLLDYFAAEKEINLVKYEHPMHGYNRRYFLENSEETKLPPSCSARNREIAEELENQTASQGITPFPLSDGCVIELDKLAEFFSGPNKYLFSDKKVTVTNSKYDQVVSKEALEAKLSKDLQQELVLTGKCNSTAAEIQVETGKAPDQDSAKQKINKTKMQYEREFKFRTYNPYTCTSHNLVEAFNKFEKETCTESTVDFKVNECQIHLHQKYKTTELKCNKGPQKFVIFYDPYSDNDSAKYKVLIRYLGANAAEGGIAAVLFGPEKKLLLPELSAEKAREKLFRLIDLAGRPLPDECPDYRRAYVQNDALPAEQEKKLSDIFNECKKG